MTAVAMTAAIRAGGGERAILRDLPDGSVVKYDAAELVAFLEAAGFRYGPLAHQLSGAFVGSAGFLFPKKKDRGIRVRKGSGPGHPPDARQAFCEIVEAEFGDLQRAAEVLKFQAISKVARSYGFHRETVAGVLGAWPPALRGRPRKAHGI